MKFDKDYKYIKIGIVAFCTIFALFIACNLVGRIPGFMLTILNFLDMVLDILSPVIIAFVITYLLLIPTRAIENFLLSRKYFAIKNRRICRAIGLIISYITVLTIIIATLIGIYYMIGGQLSKNTTINNIYNTISSYFKDETISAESLQQQLTKLNLPFADIISPKLGEIAAVLSDLIANIVSFLFGSVISLGGNLFNIVISIILSIYFIFSYEYFLRFLNKIYYVIFRKSRPGKALRKALQIINETFSAYIRGQLIEAFIVAVLSTIVLFLIDVDYAIVIGIITGICNLVPYIGPLVGTILAGIVALLGGDIFTCIWAVVGMQVVQQLDANVICPRIVGNIVGLPSAFVIIAILIGGDYAGLLGMLIAVPIAASLKTIIGFWFDKHYTDFDVYYAAIMEENEMHLHEKRIAVEEQRRQKKEARNNHFILKIISRIKPQKKD